jgi:hypothetical protein
MVFVVADVEFPRQLSTFQQGLAGHVVSTCHDIAIRDQHGATRRRRNETGGGAHQLPGFSPWLDKQGYARDECNNDVVAHVASYLVCLSGTKDPHADHGLPRSATQDGLRHYDAVLMGQEATLGPGHPWGAMITE